MQGEIEGIGEELAGLEWDENPHIKLRKVSFVTGRNNQTMDTRSRSNHGVL